MPRLTVEEFDESMEAIREAGGQQAEFLDKVNPILDELKNAFNFEAMDHCMERFISSELDFRTPGDRGMGRMSTDVPRLGGYFRKSMSKLSDSELSTLYSIIQEVVLIGYLTHALLMEEPLKKAKLHDRAQIFETWLPRVYLTNPSSTPDDLQGYMQAFSSASTEKWERFSEDHSMKGGGIFTKDKTPVIFVYYILGGYLLRVVEVGE